MARYVTTVPSRLSPAEAFAFMTDVRNVAEWDPSIRQIDLIAGDAGALGSRYRVQMSSTQLVYETTALTAGTAVTLRGENGWVVSVDEITVTPDPGGLADVTYDATLTLKGPLKLADPILRLVFGRLGDKARAGLVARIGRG